MTTATTAKKKATRTLKRKTGGVNRSVAALTENTTLVPSNPVAVVMDESGSREVDTDECDLDELLAETIGPTNTAQITYGPAYFNRHAYDDTDEGRKKEAAARRAADVSGLVSATHYPKAINPIETRVIGGSLCAKTSHGYVTIE